MASAKKDAFLRALLAHENRGAARPLRSEDRGAGENAVLRIVLEGRESGLGVSEYYASCRLPEAELMDGANLQGLLPVRPLAVEDGLLLVTRL